MWQTIDERWRAEFLRTVRQHENAGPLKEAVLRERLGDWTKQLASVTIATCNALGWQASVGAQVSDILPVRVANTSLWT